MMEAIIIAGGFGTRLRDLITDLPKPMAPILYQNQEIPLLAFLIIYLKKFGLKRLILSTGYMHEKIEEYLGDNHLDVEIIYAHEKEPLGTGGAIKHALSYSKNDRLLVLNGDSFFAIDFEKFCNLHQDGVLIAARNAINCNRFGQLSPLENGTVQMYPGTQEAGIINCGIYMISQDIFNNMNMPISFSFEQDFLMNDNITKYAYISDQYFIDIGVPEDYLRAYKEIDSRKY